MSEPFVESVADEDGPEEEEISGGWGPVWLPSALVGAATVLAVVSVFSTWTKVQALETDAWVSASEELLDDPDVQQALSVYLVDELYSQVDVSGELEKQLPDDFKGLAGPVSAALRGPATAGVERLIASEEFGAAWITLNREVHGALINVLRDETGPGVSTADGAVALEFGPLLRQVGEQLGLSDSALDALPPDAGRVTVFESDELASAQSAVAILDFLSWFLFLVVVALYAGAVYLAAGRRLEVLRRIGLSLIGAGVFVLIVRIVAVRTAIDAVIADPGNRPVAQVAAYVATGLMRQIAWSGIIYGILFVGFVAVLGQRRWATAIRRTLAPLFNASTGAQVGMTVVLLLLLVWWSPGRSFTGWVNALTSLGLIVGGLVVLGRTIRQEFPTVGIGDVTRSVGEGYHRLRLRSLPEGVAPDSLAGQLETLQSLHANGTLTEDELARAKERLLATGATVGAD